MSSLPITAAPETALDIAREILDRVARGCMISYAQNFEDVILARAFKNQEKGIYIDVGAYHPTRNSVTEHFYKSGWHGVNIDLDPVNMAQFDETRSRDTNLCLAVSCKEGSAIAYVHAGSSRSTLAKHMGDNYRARGVNIAEKDVETRCLSSLFADLKGQTVDFLKIDVEGAEADVINGNDWRAQRPRVVVVEATYPETAIPNWDQWEDVLLSANYQFAYFDGLNRFYVRDEDSALLPAFELPPNYFDNFVRADAVFMAQALIKQSVAILDV
ncbi:methyltransferase, FkbM family [Maridesulfovibrio ferrireducens]|uniref:Methyltransferase, FkbM family n=1 Tax=Maridesulfovibrio ferrireducens TaxID=246191 RepID=A0A1G9ETQ6_9BACT|nr:FkbM family methyltransferase [Maridesulfovibrio ferrireducens]SDK79418.1 methyltransferase, FkbM family [Maridesulfovibrio ferrireducens]